MQSDLVRRVFCMLAVLRLAVAGGSTAAATAADRVPVRVGFVVGPLSNTIVWNLLKHQGFDHRHGLDLALTPYPSIAAFYGGLSRGDVDVVMGGPTIFHKLVEDGVPLKVVATAQRLSDLVVLSRDPSITGLRALRGRAVAVDQTCSQYQMMEIIARTTGMNLREQARLTQASFAISKALLLAERVDAALVPEPLATLAMMQNPRLVIAFNGGEGWRRISSRDGWETVVAAREDLILRHRGVVDRLIAALRDAGQVLDTRPSEADELLVPVTRLPRGVLSRALQSGRLEFQFEPAWGPQRAAIWEVYERAVSAGFYLKLPPASIIHAPP